MASTRFDKSKVLRYIYQCLSENETPSSKQVADFCHLTHYHFSRVFTKQLGVTFQEYLSAIKIMHSIKYLLNGENITNAHLKSGFLSSPTFSNSFKKHTGIAPKQYLTNMSKFSALFHTKLTQLAHRCIYYYNFEKHNHAQIYPIRIFIENLNTNQPAFIFIGLYPKPFPKEVPEVGVALNQLSSCEIWHIPNGTYFLLLCEISLSSDKLDYFDLSHARRNIYAKPITFPLAHPLDISIELRHPLVSDPPITVNLPRMLLEGLYQSFLE
nr:helix-turn-helix domain-containing protein [Moraxella osloensis]